MIITVNPSTHRSCNPKCGSATTVLKQANNDGDGDDDDDDDDDDQRQQEEEQEQEQE